LIKRIIFALVPFLLITSSQAHKNFWEIRAFIFESPTQITLQAFFSLEHLQPHLKTSFKNDLYDVKNKEELVEELSNSINKFIEFSNIEEKPFVKAINIFTDDVEEQKLTEFPVSMVDIELEIALPLPTNGTPLKVIWKIFPDEIVKARKIKLQELPLDALKVNVHLSGSMDHKFIISREKPSFQWTPNQPSVSTHIPVEYIHKTQEKKQPYFMAILASGLLLIFICWTFINKPIIPLTTCILLTLTTLLFTGTPKNDVQTAKLNVTRLKKPFSEILRRLYSSVNSSSENQKWHLLNGILSDRLQQIIYSQNYHSNDQEKLLEKVEIQSIEQKSDKAIYCHWSTVTLVQHKTHVHERKLSFAGLFTFSPKEKNWVLDKADVYRVGLE
jgi:hypothetical protein